MSPAALGAIVALALVGPAPCCSRSSASSGPDLADRVVALDLLGALGGGIAAWPASPSGEPVYLDVAIVLALIALHRDGGVRPLPGAGG